MEINYNRWEEFIKSIGGHPNFDGLSREDRQQKRLALHRQYAQWLKEQKPKHLDFEVKSGESGV